MNSVLQRLKQHALFFYGYLFLLIAASVWLSINGKDNCFLFLNQYHRPWLDYFFIGYTYMGNGLVIILLVLILFFVFKKSKLAIILLIAYASTGILAQIIKPLVHSPRPENYFYPQRLSFFIDDIILAGDNSFPSGHTATAFAIAAVLALYTNKNWYHFLLLCAAVLVGFSRIFLSQHFLLDVLMGSFIGVLGGLLTVYLCRNLDENKLVFKKKQSAGNENADAVHEKL